MSMYSEGDIDSNERGTCARDNSGKVSFSLVPMQLLAGVARIFMGGALKYKSWNWSKGGKYSTAYDCCQRHLIKFWYCGEDLDEESGEHHLDHALCNILMLKHFIATYKEGDDRPPTEVTHFNENLEDMNKRFDEAAYLERNPAIKAMLEARE